MVFFDGTGQYLTEMGFLKSCRIQKKGADIAQKSILLMLVCYT